MDNLQYACAEGSMECYATQVRFKPYYKWITFNILTVM